MKRPKRRRQRTVYQRLTDPIPPLAHAQEVAELKGQIALLVQQRDDALNELNNLANLKRMGEVARQLADGLSEAIREIDRATRLVRRLVSLPPLEDDELLGGQIGIPKPEDPT